MLVISKNDLVALGYGEYQASDIIRKTKALMVNKGYSYYTNKRLGIVPVSAVEEVLGLELSSVAKDVGVSVNA